ncbi:hypothetical protein NMG60_11036282 [Bertholletia excelsa]
MPGSALSFILSSIRRVSSGPWQRNLENWIIGGAGERSAMVKGFSNFLMGTRSRVLWPFIALMLSASPLLDILLLRYDLARQGGAGALPVSSTKAHPPQKLNCAELAAATALAESKRYTHWTTS